MVLALTGIAALLLLAGLLVATRPPPRVEVPSVSLTTSDHVCGVRNQSLAGFDTGPGATVREVLTIQNSNASRGCTIRSVVVTTAGFGISGANTPLAVGPASRGNLTFDLLLPGTAYSGGVGLDLE